ncbi:MAG: YecA family protein [Gaiellales bacterium]|nr:MAG: YecA family protein [Gaiellales bacterium]
MQNIDIPEFSDVQAKRLRNFLADPERPQGVMDYYQLAGFLLAVGCSPEIIMPSEWMPVVFGGNEPEYEDEDEAREILGALMSLYNRVAAEIAGGTAQLPPALKIFEDPMANLEPEAPLCRWSKGFASGHAWLNDLWTEILPDELDDEFNINVFILTFFAGRRFAEKFFHEARHEGKSSLKPKTFEDFTAKILQLFPDALQNYALMGHSAQQAIMNLDLAATPPQPGRNDPCPCGSEKKYKKCCLDKGTAAGPARPTTDRVYQLKVTLKGSKPPIWRRILVPDTALDRLSDYLLTVMGWTGGHLHAFRISDKHYGTIDIGWSRDDLVDERTVNLSDVVSSPQKKFTYDYDFGDGWEHEVLVEDILDPEPDASYPLCVAGRRACPPEDVGGIYGYYEFLKAITDPGHPAHEEMVGWIGGDFDPKAFDLKQANEDLQYIAGQGSLPV